MWTLGVPFQNVKSYVISKPPAVVFALCIASFGVVTLSLGLYVKHTTTKLKDPDDLSWNDIGKRFNKLKFCAKPMDLAPLMNTTNMEAVSIPFEIDLPIHNIWKNYTLISGSSSASDFGLHDHLGMNLSFSISLNTQSQNKICLSVFHPATVFLPKVYNPCNPLQFNPLPRSVGAWVLPQDPIRGKDGEIKKRPSTVQCPDNHEFDLKLLENPEWIVYLDEADRTLVHLHLMATSAFMFVTFMTMLCYAVVRGGLAAIGRPKTIKTTILQTARVIVDDKEPIDP